MAHYSKLQLKLDLLGKLSVAQKQKSEGDKGKTLKQIMAVRWRLQDVQEVRRGLLTDF